MKKGEEGKDDQKKIMFNEDFNHKASSVAGTQRDSHLPLLMQRFDLPPRSSKRMSRAPMVSATNQGTPQIMENGTSIDRGDSQPASASWCTSVFY